MALTRTHYLDTSAIVKLFLDEPGSDAIRRYHAAYSVFAITSISFAETLGVFKTKFLRGAISTEAYLSMSEELMALIRDENLQIDDIEISRRDVFDEVERLIQIYALDIADAYQLVTLKQGAFAKFTEDSQPILITADRKLCAAARSEELRVWDCLSEAAP